MKRLLGLGLLFAAVFAAAVLLLNTDPPQSEAKPLVIAGAGGDGAIPLP